MKSAKQYRLTKLLVCAGVLVFTSAVCGDVNYSDFSTTNGLTLLGSAAQHDVLLRLTSASSGKLGTVWAATRQDVGGGFVTTFEFSITEAGGGADSDNAPGGDGFAFVIQNQGETASATGGGGNLGYKGITCSLAVEFDTFNNAGWGNGDPNGNHISVQSRGTEANDADHQYSLGMAHNLPDLSNGNVHTATIEYENGTLRVFLDGGEDPIIEASVNLAQTLGLTAGKAWVGFTASTGAAFENHDILSWSFEELVEPTPTATPTEPTPTTTPSEPTPTPADHQDEGVLGGMCGLAGIIIACAILGTQFALMRRRGN